MSLIPTGSQTVGPFFNFGLTSNQGLGIMAGEGALGERIRLEFQVIDGEGVPTPGDSMIELWQADSQGRYENGDPDFCGFGRMQTQGDGTCVFETVKPGSAAGHAPHITVLIFARGLQKHLHTRVYFDGDPANAGDPVLALVPEARRPTLLAQQVNGQPGFWRMKIRLQGQDETVFFEA